MEKRKISRRTFLQGAIFGISGLIGAALGIPAIAYIIGPALKNKQVKEWIHLGATAKVETGKPALFKAKLQSQTGWITNEEELDVYVLTENGRDYIALSNVCTHLGCHIRWISEKDQFFCPCHNGVFDKEGKVVSGPPPRSLDRFTTKVEKDQIYIQGV